MTRPATRIAMWSGPRNISTAMMRSFENRPDTAVIDEPFYAAYLKATGIDHPLRAETLAAHESDWRVVVRTLTGPIPDRRAVFYQKHMTHHMLPQFDLGWMDECSNVFLIRSPKAVLASYTAKRARFWPAEVGFARQRELFDRECDRRGRAPSVIDAEDVLRSPRASLEALCRVLGIEFSERMLHWPAGRRATDGAWAPAWYDAVERSTGFAGPRVHQPLTDALQRLADAVRPCYEHLAKYKLTIHRPTDRRAGASDRR